MTVNYFEHKKKGMMLLEILVVVGIFVVISSSVWPLMANIFSQGTMLRNSLAANDEARIAIKKFIQEARIMSPSSLGAYPVLLASSTAFTFYSDVDNDNLKERYRYFIEGGSFKKGVTKPSGTPLVYNSAAEIKSIIITHLYATSSTLFNYFDSNNTQMAYPMNATAIRSVELLLPIAFPSQQGLRLITFSSRVTMRTLKDNY
jgi:type II secretory pathway pseudopilin PulG